ncbi:MAG: hypothetical protein ACKORG_00725 [Actinomycetota bacterium]
MRPRVFLAIAACACAATPLPALGAMTTARDARDRPIVFDVRAKSADVAGYADVLRRSVHGDEIRTVSIRVVPRSRIRAHCRDARAVACYSGALGRGTITIPARPAREVQATLLHEYGHHVDATVRTPRWWSARRMGAKLRSGKVAMDYSRGWSRSVGEVFAEDYVALHMRGVYSIRWLRQPSESILRALQRDITGRSDGLPPVASDPVTDPSVPVGGAALSRTLRSGTVGMGRAMEIPVTLDGPNRHVTAVVRPDPAGGTVAVDVEVACDGMTPSTYAVGAGEAAYLQVGPVGPGACMVRASGPADASGAVSVEVVIALSGGGAAPAA